MASASDLDARAAELRGAILSRHALLAEPDADGDFVDGPWGELMRLTGQLLDTEEDARTERLRVARGRTVFLVRAVVLAILVAAVAVAVREILDGGLSFWQWTGVVLAIVLALVLAVPRPDAAADTDGTRRLDAALFAVGGAGLLLAASGLLAWWGAAIVAVVAAVAVAQRFLMPGRGRP